MGYEKEIIITRKTNDRTGINFYQDTHFTLIKEYPHGALYVNDKGIKEFFTPFELGQVKSSKPPRKHNNIGFRNLDIKL